MKKIARLIMLAAVVATMAAGCQKEEAARVAANSAVAVGPRQVEYSVDGVRQHVTAQDEAEWQALLAGSFDQVDQGHLVSLNHGLGTNPAKENIVYTTDIRDSAMAWVGARFNEGYDVTMWYDTEENKYICVASKVAPPANVAPNGYVYQPLQQYLVGEWTLCLDCKTELAPGASSVTLDPEYGILSMTWEQIYNFYMIVPDTSDQTGALNLQIASDTISVHDGNIVYAKHIPYFIDNEMIYTAWPEESFLNFRAFEWSQDTMLVFYRAGHHILPKIYIKVQ